MDGGMMMMMIENFISFHPTLIACLCYSFFISSRIPKGLLRFISLLPVFYLFTILPLYLSSVFLTAVSTFFLTWLANFKIALFAFGLGPLSTPESSRALHVFIASAALPIRAKPDNSQSGSSSPEKKLPILNNLGLEILAAAVLIGSVIHYKEKFHPKFLLIIYCCMVFLLVDCLVASSSLVVRALVGLDLEPPSNEPYFSTSLQEFWGKRWNLTVTNTLRLAVYKPVRSASAGLLGSEWAPVPALLAAFLVSGLMHELLFYYATRARPSWEMTGFFVLHGVCVVLELGIKKLVALNGKWVLPRFVSGPLTVGFVMLTSFWLFFPPLIRNGADAAVIEEFRTLTEFVRNGIFNQIGK